jgi:hypothetical protein
LRLPRALSARANALIQRLTSHSNSRTVTGEQEFRRQEGCLPDPPAFSTSLDLLTSSSPDLVLLSSV